MWPSGIVPRGPGIGAWPRPAVPPSASLPFGAGLRFLHKTSDRSYFECLGLLNFCDDPAYERQGIFFSETILF